MAQGCDTTPLTVPENVAVVGFIVALVVGIMAANGAVPGWVGLESFRVGMASMCLASYLA